MVEADGSSVGLRIVDGRLYVADIIATEGPFVVLRLWGCTERIKLFACDIASWCVVGPHDYAQARNVMGRQREGLTAA